MPGLGCRGETAAALWLCVPQAADSAAVGLTCRRHPSSSHLHLTCISPASHLHFTCRRRPVIISTPKPLLALVRHLGGTDRLHSRRALRNGAELTKLAAGLQARRLRPSK